jgi:putative DNA primase/helicase
MTDAVISIKSRAVFARASAALYAASDDDAKIAFVASAAGELAHDLEALGRLSESAINVHGLAPDAVQAAIVKGIKRAPRKKKRGMRFVPLSDVRPEPVRWLWPDRVARKFVLFTGPPDCGKTTCAIDVAARVTTGSEWPDGSGNAPLGSVLILTAEDGVADTIRTRAEAAGADLSRIHCLESVHDADGKPSSFSLQQDVGLLAEHVREVGDVALVVIDPITAYLGSVDSHKAAEVRAILSPLKDFADEHRVSIIGLTHPSKSVDRAMNAAGGSGAFIAAARSGWLFVRELDEEGGETGRTLMTAIKNNLSGKRANGLAYRLMGRDIGDGISAPYISWDREPVGVTADQALASVMEAGGRASSDGGKDLAAAMEWVREEFLVRERIEAADLVEWARKAGITEKTLRTARVKLGVATKRDGFGPGAKYYLSLPPMDAT